MHYKGNTLLVISPKIQLPFDRIQSGEYNNLNPKGKENTLMKAVAMSMMMEMYMCPMCMRRCAENTMCS